MNTSTLHGFLLLIVSLTTVSQSFADFSLVCPPDVTVSCREDYLHDLNVYGKAYTDYNGIIQFQHDCKTIIEIVARVQLNAFGVLKIQKTGNGLAAHR